MSLLHPSSWHVSLEVIRVTPFMKNVNFTGIYDQFLVVLWFILPSYTSLNNIKPTIFQGNNKNLQKSKMMFL